MNDDFTLRNRLLQLWLVALVVGVAAIAVVFPPSFWVCAVGGGLLATSSIANSARTGQWYSWQNGGSLNWFEGWAATSGVVLLVVPLVSIVLLSRMS